MAKRKKGGEDGGSQPDNDFSADDAKEYFDSLDEISERMKADSAASRGDMNAVYDKMVANLGVDKESAKFLWNRHAAEKRFAERAKKMDTATRRSLERFRDQMDGTPFGEFAAMALEDAGDGKPTITSSKKRKEKADAKAAAEKEKADA